MSVPEAEFPHSLLCTRAFCTMALTHRQASNLCQDQLRQESGSFRLKTPYCYFLWCTAEGAEQQA